MANFKKDPLKITESAGIVFCVMEVIAFVIWVISLSFPVFTTAALMVSLGGMAIFLISFPVMLVALLLFPSH